MDEIDVYGTTLNMIGDTIISVSKAFGDEEEIASNRSLASLKLRLEHMQRGQQAYQQIRQVLIDTQPPAKIAQEHRELIDSYDDFLDGTKLLVESIDLERVFFDQEKYHLGHAKQVISEVRTQEVLERIINNLS